MRIEKLALRNIAGLADGDFELGQEDVIAFAGPNGAGKSKLLLCFIAPWLSNLPPPQDSDQSSSVSVTFELAESERTALDRYSSEAGWHQGPIPELVTFTVE